MADEVKKVGTMFIWLLLAVLFGILLYYGIQLALGILAIIRGINHPESIDFSSYRTVAKSGCWSCHGTGKVHVGDSGGYYTDCACLTEVKMPAVSTGVCLACNGSGYYFGRLCGRCNGSGRG